MFAGLCVGGPLDGRRVQHDAPRYNAVSNPPEVPAVYDRAAAPVDLKLEVFTYFHYRAFDTGFWLPLQLRSGGVYQHRRWDSPEQFLLRTLAAGYNPEGY